MPTLQGRQESLRLSDLFKQDLVLLSDRFQEIRYKENRSDYLWGKTMMRMILEIQCVAVAFVVTSQVWILTSYGSKIFEKLVGDEIVMPLLYLLAIIMGTLTYVRPCYWRIATSLTLYSVCIYFSLLVIDRAVKLMMTAGMKDSVQLDDTNSGVWIPWTIGFALHMQICLSSAIIAFISIRDMYKFNPQVVTEERAPDVVVSSVVGNVNEKAQGDKNVTNAPIVSTVSVNSTMHL